MQEFMAVDVERLHTQIKRFPNLVNSNQILIVLDKLISHEMEFRLN